MNYIVALLIMNGLNDYDAYVVFEYIMEELRWKSMYIPPLSHMNQMLECLHSQLSAKCKQLVPILYYDKKGSNYESVRINGGLCVHIMTLCAFRYSAIEFATYIMGVFLMGIVLIRGR